MNPSQVSASISAEGESAEGLEGSGASAVDPAAADVVTPDKKPEGYNNFEYRIWGSPVKKLKVSEPGPKKVNKPGNPHRLSYEKAEKCSLCSLEKIPADMPAPTERILRNGKKRKIAMLHHGSRCHFCHIKAQFFKRKYGIPSTSMAAFSEIQCGHIKSESMAFRMSVLGHH